MKPQATLEDCFGPGVGFNPRVPYSGRHFVKGLRGGVDDFVTGTFLTFAGGTRLVCHAGAVTTEGLELMQEAGLPGAPNLATYDGPAQYASILLEFERSGQPLGFQHIHPEADAPPSVYAVDRRTLAFLNNKANLGQLVPLEHTPRRQVLAMREAVALVPSPGHPLVLKGATDLSSGGGGIVSIARCTADIQRACGEMQSCEAIVVEEYLPFLHTYCLNYLTDGSRVRYLGSAEQITDQDGDYLGNWFDSETPGPEAGIEAGMETMRLAAAMGYRGFAGFDMGLLPDGSVMVFDLNFRLCGSTVGLLWQPALREARGPFHGRIATFAGTASFQEMCESARSGLRAGILVPFGTLDPTLGNLPGVPPRLRAMVLGKDRDEVEERRLHLADLGLTS